uniref:Uncharacterized protein n=1 Tax=Molossus molossus TaxID=27622 RepID=A0A7J8C8U4_MOLMO|nr:hypothetical protein HJG59_009907 [Molossus molossus]
MLEQNLFDDLLLFPYCWHYWNKHLYMTQPCLLNLAQVVTGGLRPVVSGFNFGNSAKTPSRISFPVSTRDPAGCLDWVFPGLKSRHFLKNCGAARNFPLEFYLALAVPIISLKLNQEFLCMT